MPNTCWYRTGSTLQAAKDFVIFSRVGKTLCVSGEWGLLGLLLLDAGLSAVLISMMWLWCRGRRSCKHHMEDMNGERSAEKWACLEMWSAQKKKTSYDKPLSGLLFLDIFTARSHSSNPQRPWHPPAICCAKLPEHPFLRTEARSSVDVQTWQFKIPMPFGNQTWQWKIPSEWRF